METEIITTEDKDIVIERIYTEKRIDKKELRQEKQEINPRIRELENKIERLSKVNIKDEFQYIIDMELANFNIELDVLKSRLQIIEGNLIK